MEETIMRRWLSLCLGLLLSVTAAFAQQWWGYDGGADLKRSQWGIDLGVGKMKDVQGNVGFAGGIRYQYNIHPLIGWDLGANYVGQTIDHEGIGPSVLQGLIGLRGRTPSFYEDLAGTLGVRMGYGHDFETKEGGFALEMNVGMYLTSHVMIGYVYNMQKLKFEIGDGKYKFHGFRLGFVF